MTNRVARQDKAPLPIPSGSYSDAETILLLWAYRKDPSDVPCPRCGPDTIEVLAFIEPAIDPQGLAVIREPRGNYAAALFCHICHRSVGILMHEGDAS